MAMAVDLEPWSSSEYVAPERFPAEHHRVAEWAWGPLMVQAPPSSPDDKLMQGYTGEARSSSSEVERFFFDQLTQEHAGGLLSSKEEGLFLDQLMQEFTGGTFSQLECIPKGLFV